MIRKLTEQDRRFVLEYLYKEASYNIFIIGDIETFGFDTDFQTIYGEFNQDNAYLSVLLFYRESSIYTSHLTTFNKEYATILKHHNFNYMSGKEDLMVLVNPYLDGFDLKPMYFCKADKFEKHSTTQENIREVKTDKDIEKLYNLFIQIEEFGISCKRLDDFTSDIKSGLKMGIKLYIEKDNKIVSSVSSTAETTVNAMVVGVATDPSYRQKGYASMLMSSLMAEYFHKRNKELCLFYDNPNAGKIYKRLGFKDIGKWAMMKDTKS